jgi:predicted house-cleaning noncanonical NTP pyrophosphatase (MazG superfamily)
MKLVRDRIGDVPWPDRYPGDPLGEAAKQYLGRVDTDSAEYATLLRDKLPEETAEVLEAANDGLYSAGECAKLLDEAADLYEVLLALLIDRGVATSRTRAADRLHESVIRKFIERGGFTEGTVYHGPVRETHPHRPERG